MSKSVLRPLMFQIQSAILRRLCHEPPQLSNTERPPKDPPDEGYEPTSVDHDGIDVPDFVNPAAFRQFSDPDEQLGPGAGKAAEYKNGHYFAYHRFSFYELQTQTTELRDEGGLQASIQADEESEDQENQLGTMKKLEAECDEILAGQAKEIGAVKKEAPGKKAAIQEKKKLKAQIKGKEKPKEVEKAGKSLKDMSEEDLEEWCVKKEAAIKEKEKSKAESKGKENPKEEVKERKPPKGEIKEEKLKEARARKSLQDMNEKELEEWCVKKEAAIKEKEKSKEESKGKESPKEEIKEKKTPKGEIKEEKLKEAKAGKSLKDMSEKELNEWCLKKEANIKELLKKKAEQAKKCEEEKEK